MLNGHKMSCPRCEAPLTELQITYLDYTNMSRDERTAFTARLRDPERLSRLSTTYRMYKYSKWYKELQRQLAQPVIHSYAMPETPPLENAVSIL